MLGFLDEVEKKKAPAMLTANIRNDLGNPANDGNKILRMSEHFTILHVYRMLHKLLAARVWSKLKRMQMYYDLEVCSLHCK